MFIKDGDSGENLLGKGYAKVHFYKKNTENICVGRRWKLKAFSIKSFNSFSVHLLAMNEGTNLLTRLKYLAETSE